MAEQEPPDELEANERGVEVEPPLITIQKEEEEQQQQEDVSTSEKSRMKWWMIWRKCLGRLLLLWHSNEADLVTKLILNGGK